MKKAIALFLALVSLVTISVPAHAAPADYEMNLDDLTTTSSTYFVSAEEREAEHQRQLEAHLRQLGIDLSECVIMGDGTSAMPMGDASNYRIEYIETQPATVDEDLSNQPTSGVSFSHGGSVLCTMVGGPSISVSVPFTIPGTTYTFSVSVGIFDVAPGNNVDGYIVDIPAGGIRYRVGLERIYQVRYYKIYNKRWNERIWGYEWVEYSDGFSYSLDAFDFYVYQP